MKKYIFTFGIGTPNKRRYQVIYAKDYEAARNLMLQTWGKEWCWQYSEEAWAVTLNNCPVMREYTPLDDVIYQQE